MNLKAMQADLNAYLAAVRIETDGEPRPFAEVADAWQSADIAAIAPALTTLVSNRKHDPDEVKRASGFARAATRRRPTSPCSLRG